MYQSLYRKWRPQTFDEIVGQDSITSLLKRQAAENRVSHAYLFTGSRGTGKTTSAKVLAKVVNCEHPVDGNPCNECWACKAIDSGSATDVLEIDAASNNRVEDVRSLIDEVVYPPTAMKKRVYIVDEVHMLSDSAFNALLKTLEEPPSYVLFILATTEINELPATIISRCMRFDFHRIEPDVLAARARYVADKESINITDEALLLIAKLGDGAARDTLSLLESCAAWKGIGNRIEISDVREMLGISDNDILVRLFTAIRSRDVSEALNVIALVHSGSSDPTVFLEDMIGFVRDSLIAKNSTKKEQYLRERFFFSTSAFEKIPPLLASLTSETLLYYVSVLEDTLSAFSRYTIDKKTLIDLAVIKLCDPSMSISVKAVTARISELERKVALLSSGAVVCQPEAPVTHEEAPVEAPPAAERVPFTGYSEVRDMLAGEPALQAIFGKCRMYVEGTKLIVEGGAFTVKALSAEKYDGKLKSIIAGIAGNKYSIEYREIQRTGSDVDIFDEIGG